MTENTDLSQVERLAASMERLEKTRFVAMHDALWQLIWFQFLKGMAFGFGTIIGATALVGFFISFLNFFDFIPFIGGWMDRYADTLQTEANVVAPPPKEID